MDLSALISALNQLVQNPCVIGFVIIIYRFFGGRQPLWKVPRTVLIDPSTARTLLTFSTFSMSYFYVDAASNQPLGPVSLDNLRELHRLGTLHDHSPVIEEGNTDWRTCSDFLPPDTTPWKLPSVPLHTEPSATGHTDTSHTPAFARRGVSLHAYLAFVALALAVLSLLSATVSGSLAALLAIGATGSGIVAWRFRGTFGHGGVALAALCLGGLGLLAGFSAGQRPVLAARQPSTKPKVAATEDFGNPAGTEWKTSIYAGGAAPYNLLLPSYWHETKPLDAQADRAFLGPKGMVLSVYVLDDDKRSWAAIQRNLRETAQVTAIKPQGNPDADAAFFLVDSAPVNGLHLSILSTVITSDWRIALSVRTPTDLPTRVFEAVQFHLGYLVQYMTEAVEDRKQHKPTTRTQDWPVSNDPLLLELAKAARAEQLVKAGETGNRAYPKEGWRQHFDRNFGTPGSRVVNEADLRRVMGVPDRTQTISGDKFWYYACADGTVQVILRAGIVIEANDY